MAEHARTATYNKPFVKGEPVAFGKSRNGQPGRQGMRSSGVLSHEVACAVKAAQGSTIKKMMGGTRRDNGQGSLDSGVGGSEPFPAHTQDDG